jgi:EAL domain-containing protein (putative c-di-GMP-specific phosphodiesterase class I)
VDDDAETARALKRIVTSAGHSVHIALSGQAGLEALGNGDFDVVLSDIGMPGMNGFDLLGAIKRVDANIPIVLLTGDPTVSTAALALEVGAFRYVPKPVQTENLLEVVEKAAGFYRMALMKAKAAELLGHESQNALDFFGLNRSFNRCVRSLRMAFQPIVDARQGTVFGYEALMRSQEPELPRPESVLSAAERLGRLTDLGRAVRSRTAARIDAALESSCIFVNLHVRDLLDDDLSSPRCPLSAFADRIVLEVTERASMAEVPDATERLATLRKLGYRIAIDDLGAGYAGLTSFALLEPEFIKLDMSLIRKIHQSRTKTKVVGSMINLAQDMGMLVVAEGIEDAEENQALLDLGCDYLQGYFYGRPSESFLETR